MTEHSGQPPAETQASVFEWCEEHYPDDDKAQKLVNLLEEVTELGCVLGVSSEAMMQAVKLTVAKSDDPVGDRDYMAKELGDVQLSVLNLAQSLEMDAMGTMDRVMQANRLRTTDESASRSARKRAMGLRG
jgi:NTP pyrophosphatase (non-canonical NTP hydrolase)